MDIGLSQEQIAKSAAELHKVLAAQHVLYQKLRNFHWNIEGKHFLDLHEFFEESYNELSEDIDVIAERIRSLGVKTEGNFSKYLEAAAIKEPTGTKTQEEMVKELSEDNDAMAKLLRTGAEACDDNDDTGNEDILIGLMEKHEKRAWMLRSML